MRTILLWLSENRWLRRVVPRLGFVRRGVARFMPGEDLESALDAAVSLHRARIGAVLTRLGENVTEKTEADAVAEHYHSVLEEAVRRGVDVEPSVKLTQLGLDVDRELAFGHLDALAEHASQLQSYVWVDMEGSSYTDVTLELYERVRERHENVGLCLQAYLHRTAADVERLLPLRPGIRLVKGAYREPAAIALQRGADVDANFQALATLLLPAASAGNARVALGTHDTRLVARIDTFRVASGAPKSTFQVHMLYGIRPDDQRRLAEDGFTVRCLIAYGSFWYPWYLRRLAERPANLLFALRQLLP